MAEDSGQEDWDVLWREVTDAFSPGAPIQERDLFAGRAPELQALTDAVQQRGRHAVLFGERGVGKTSLANILPLAIVAPAREVAAVRVNASPTDTFDSLWRKVFKRFSYAYADGSGSRKLADELPEALTPDDVQLALEGFTENQIPVVILDEFDRIADPAVTGFVADTIKALSDYSVNVTIVVVGVAEDVAGLIAGHESVSRSLLQVKMPRMSQDELGDIIAKRYKKLGITASADVLWKITFLSRGLPYYTHMLAMYAARNAVGRKHKAVTETDLDQAMKIALGDIDQMIRERYLGATVSQRPNDTLYEPVLLACALAVSDELGRFQQAAVTTPLNKIVSGKNYAPATFAFHMNAFCTPQRQNVLERLGEARNYRYRFSDPMMQPFVILKGLHDGRITDEIADIFATKRQLRLSADF
jgi:Cdc6-like AAA superfamily ATPase